MLDLLLLEATLDDQTLGTVDRAGCTQFSKQELDDVLGLTMQAKRKSKRKKEKSERLMPCCSFFFMLVPFGNVRDVGKDGLFVALTSDLRRHNGVLLLLADELGVLLP